jgi:tRNA A37 threonylcarbamoyladenosine dehydratase
LFGYETVNLFDFSQFDYIVDAIDTVTSKLLLIETANDLNIPIISSMGTGNKLDPTMLQVSDISKTSVCPLARVMRTELKKRGIMHLKVVYSKEQPLTPAACEELPEGRRAVPGSTAFVPSAAGLIIAGEVVKDLIK